MFYAIHNFITILSYTFITHIIYYNGHAVRMYIIWTVFVLYKVIILQYVDRNLYKNGIFVFKEKQFKLII